MVKTPCYCALVQPSLPRQKAITTCLPLNEVGTTLHMHRDAYYIIVGIEYNNNLQGKEDTLLSLLSRLDLRRGYKTGSLGFPLLFPLALSL